MISIKFYTESDVLLASCDAGQVPPEGSGITISHVKYRVRWIEWEVSAGLHAYVFLKKT